MPGDLDALDALRNVSQILAALVEMREATHYYCAHHKDSAATRPAVAATVAGRHLERDSE